MGLRNRKTVFAATAGLLLLVAFVLPSSIFRRGKGLVHDAMAPAQRGASSFAKRLSEARAAIRGIGGQAEENIQLRHDLIKAQAELKKLGNVEAENLRLRRALGFYERSSHQLIACDVISRTINGWWHSVLLGKGTKEGIKRDRAVISLDGLVGKTADVSATTAEVLLVCDPACRVAATILGRRAFGLVRGQGADAKGRPIARMFFINKDAEVNIGDEVVTSGLAGDSGIFPKGIYIGRIVTVARDESGLYQYADIFPAATGNLLETLFVISSVKGEGES